MRTVAYLRVSTGGQDLATQKLAILDYARRHRFTIAQFVEARFSSRRAGHREQVLQIIEALQGAIAWSSANCPGWAGAWGRSSRSLISCSRGGSA
jgi:hypothetical protein